MPIKETEIIEVAREYGIDVEPERCDFAQLAADLDALNDMPEPFRAVAVERLNRGEPVRLSDEWAS
jgi:hypothetical protein